MRSVFKVIFYNKCKLLYNVRKPIHGLLAKAVFQSLFKKLVYSIFNETLEI